MEDNKGFLRRRTVALTEDTDKAIEDQVKSGKFDSASAAIRRAIRIAFIENGKKSKIQAG